MGPISAMAGLPCSRPVLRGFADQMAARGRPRFAKLSVNDEIKVRLHPCIRTFAAASPMAPMESCWSGPLSLCRTQGAAVMLGFADHGLTCLAITG